MKAKEMLRTHPQPTSDSGGMAECIEACFECAQTCTACADACLGEDMVAELRHCIRLNLDCADVCDTTGRLMSRQTMPDPRVAMAQVQACIAACRACGDECARHAEEMDMAHCRVCAEACRRCEEACQQMMRTAA